MSFKKRLLLGLPLIAFIAKPVIAQESFQSELEVDAVSHNDNFDYRSEFRWYFHEVDVGRGPISEQAFLSKTSFAQLGANYVKSESSNKFGRGGFRHRSSETTGVNVSGRLFTSENSYWDLGFYHYIDNNKTFMRFPAGGSVNINHDDRDNLIEIGYGRYLNDVSSLTFTFLDISNDFLDRDQFLSLKYKKLFLNDNNGMSHALRASFGVGDGYLSSLGYSFYPSETLGVGADINYRKNDSDWYSNDDELDFSLTAEYSFNPNSTLKLGYKWNLESLEVNGGAVPDDNGANVSFSYRF